MVPRTPVLYVRHAALDSVDPDDVDGLREVWSSFSGAKQSLNQGARLEYLTWRLYSRGIMQRHREKQEHHVHEEVPSIVEPPALEMSSSSESIGPSGRLSSQRLIELFDRICTNPATPEGSFKPTASSQIPTINVPPHLEEQLEPERNSEQHQQTSMPELHEAPKSDTIKIQQVPEPEVCGFDRVSVNSRSSASLHDPSLSSGVQPSGQPTGRGMFFIESSSDSEPEIESNIPVPVPVRPGFIRRKTVTFEEPKPSEAEESEAGDWQDEDDDDDDDDEEDGDSWGDSDWDDLSDDEEPMFTGRTVPSQPLERRSLLSSMFASASSTDIPHLSVPGEIADNTVPSPDSAASNPDLGTSPSLGRIESQSSLFGSAMRNRGNVEQIILGGMLNGHIPIDNEGELTSSNRSDEVMERELSQSIRTNLSNRRRYDIDVLWKPNRGQDLKTQRSGGNIRPGLSRSTTLPVRPSEPDHENDINDSQSYHARGW